VGLWDVLANGGGTQNIATVQALTQEAAEMLLLVERTFPDYTRHDEQHAKNVIALIEKLLGPAIDNLDPLEAAMLILAAYFHDIGMVYDQAELAGLADDPDFQRFLDENPAAYLRVAEAAEIPGDIVVEFCRARHAERAAHHLARLKTPARWNGAALAPAQALLGQSHTRPWSALYAGDFRPDFLTRCDLRMCAILLRLADIMDLDRTRSPEHVYDWLRLAGEATGARAVSNAEWTKHLASWGFGFPDKRTPNYPVMFVANPEHPTVEHVIRRFLDVVEEEMRGCRMLLDSCDLKWRSLALPGSVDRSTITSIGYRYGEYRFSLDREAVLGLFMGDRLYSDSYVFIRELLQNAVDACRLHVYLHDVPQDRMEVRVSAWEDEDGFYWLRVDDTGAGMDQGIVEKYFLGVGRSYYRSDELQADILRRNKPRQKFVAISRFGIGVLSSFIVGDRIEVSTRRRRPDGQLAAPLRLSLDSLDDFFVMQQDPDDPARFPGRNGWERGYRKHPGTSVAVRINPAKSEVAFDRLLDYAGASFHFPPVRVYLNDAERRGHDLTRLDVPLIQAPFQHVVTQEEVQVASGVTGLLATTTVTVTAIPLDLTAHSPSPAIRGQLIAVTADAAGMASLLPALPDDVRNRLPSELVSALDHCILDRAASIIAFGGALQVRLDMDCRRETVDRLQEWLILNPGESAARQLAASLEQGLGKEPEAEFACLSATYQVPYSALMSESAASLFGRQWLGHNGIRVPTYIPGNRFPGDNTDLALVSSGNADIFGPVCLLDELRPDVSVSRDVLRALDYPVYSALHLAVRRAAKIHLGTLGSELAEEVMDAELRPMLWLDELTSGQIEDDPLLPEWCAEQIIQAGDEKRSVAEIRHLIQDGLGELVLSGVTVRDDSPWPRTRRSRFHWTLQTALAELKLDVELAGTASPGNPRLTVRSANPPARPPGLAALPPRFAMCYESPDILMAPGCPVNLRHPIGQWLGEWAGTLSVSYPALFAQLKRALDETRSNTLHYGDWKNRAAGDMNRVLRRIQRAMPEASAELSAEVYIDEDDQMRTR